MPGLQTAKELRAKRANLAEQMKAILAAPKGEKKGDVIGLSDEQRAEFDRMNADVDALKGDIDRIEKYDAIDAECRESTGRRTVEDTDASDERAVAKQKKDTDRAFVEWMRYGTQGLGERDRAIMAKRAAPVEGRRTVENDEDRALSTNVDTTGGYLVPESMSGSIDEALLFFGGMREANTFKLTTSGGGDLLIPTSNDTTNSGVRVGEGNTNTEQGITFGQAKLGAYTYSSKIVKVNRQLLQDAVFDIAGFVGRKLGERLGRIQNTEFTTGTGASQPYGIAATATSGVAGATGQTTSIIYNDVVDLVHSVGRSYRQGSQFMFADLTLAILRKLKDGNGYPIWQPGLSQGEPDRILGFEYVINNDVATMAASAKSVFFGQWSKYWIRDVQGTILLRLEELYAANLQVGFLAFSRADGNLIDAGTHPIKYYANSAS